ncbi:TPA: ESPR-type extended signal peptide-containing protein, partial [Mannheimia haemolytica]
MNKIYKVIWNYATQSSSVASELTKNRGKTAQLSSSESEDYVKQVLSFDKLCVLALSAAILQPVQAAEETAGTPQPAASVEANSENQNLEYRYFSVNPGNDTYPIRNGLPTSNYNNDGARGIRSLAVGAGAQAGKSPAEDPKLSTDATAVGHKAWAGAEAVAVGSDANAWKERATAIGHKTRTEAGSTALGYGASAVPFASVALGAYSKAERVSNVAPIASINGVVYGGFTEKADGSRQYQFAGADPDTVLATVSVGISKVTEEEAKLLVEGGVDPDKVKAGNSYYRTITHVAAGQISASSTDAINGSQLYYALADGYFNLKQGNAQKDQVKWGDSISIANGAGTTAEVTVDPASKTSTVKYSVNKSNLNVAANGTVTAASQGDYFATAQQVANAINTSSFALYSDDKPADSNGVRKGDTLNIVKGSNTKAVITSNGTKSDIQINVIGLPIQYTTKDGKPVVKVGDEYFEVDENGKPTDKKVLPENIITQAINPAAKPNEIGNPTSITNVTSGLTTATVTGAANGSLLNLNAKTGDNFTVSNNTVATVGDLRNMGWIVSASGTSGNNYTEIVKNANEVKFIGTNGIIVDGETKENVREITVNGTLFETKKNDTNDGYIITITQPDGSKKDLEVKNGKDGISPVAKVEKQGDTATITITDAKGTSTTTI